MSVFYQIPNSEFVNLTSLCSIGTSDNEIILYFPHRDRHLEVEDPEATKVEIIKILTQMDQTSFEKSMIHLETVRTREIKHSIQYGFEQIAKAIKSSLSTNSYQSLASSIDNNMRNFTRKFSEVILTNKKKVEDTRE